MEHWRQCALWLINCKVLPPNHRVTWESAQVFDLAQTLRDGVLLCQLLNNLRPQSINLREINLRPQMSQFLCLKNIRTFLHACSEIFGMKKSELFEAFDLFDVRDFGKVMDTLSKLSHTHIAQQTGIRAFPTEESVEDEDIYNHLEDLIDENGVEDEEDLYDCVYDDDEGGEVYEDLMKVELVQPQELVKHTHDGTDKSNLRQALDAMKWCHGFYLTHNQGQNGFEFFFKTKELKKKWLEQFGMALSNICPESGKSNFHEFRMHTFETTTSCSSCEMLLRGVFYQGYRCSKCGAGAHKECLGRVDVCVKSSADSSSLGSQIGKTPCHGGDADLPKMQVIRNYYGVPSPLCSPPLNIQVGDIIEVIEANVRSRWWKGKILATKEVGFFPSDAVKPCPCVPKPVDYSSQPWFAGPMERLQAEAALLNRRSSTYLVRHRSREFNEYAISIKYNNDVKHIKILTKEGFFYIAENRKFRSILELIEYYKHHSLREGFRTLDTTLQFAYRDPENGANTPLLYGLSFLTPAGYSFVPPSTAPFWSVFTPKVMGVAIARYDFSSRDTRELSLQEGDVVKIYSKTGANGWWRGEVNGRVGWFPSTYVEEGEE
ncbi:guanine nucleotide exchange factor VAV3-like [Sinocyclocheilus grahami]|uniref:guanine nucleotide exchange factor VAV3-like n=1 Tax=Sinocyclocheilus grahami TaxID=75366 RepID=UPI0007ACDE63|nr:PREDICTED: guanine nucleotide exchange factor VAV3-like [Sinocyclocheilus grahami]